jgi:hypothetical protein
MRTGIVGRLKAKTEYHEDAGEDRDTHEGAPSDTTHDLPLPSKGPAVSTVGATCAATDGGLSDWTNVLDGGRRPGSR